MLDGKDKQEAFRPSQEPNPVAVQVGYDWRQQARDERLERIEQKLDELLRRSDLLA